MDRSYRIAPDGQSVLCDTVSPREELEVLGDALGWRRAQLARTAFEGADAVHALRALMTLDDMFAAPPQVEALLVTLTRAQAVLLCEIAGAYVAERDLDAYQSPEERNRIAVLRTISGPLMDCCCEFAGAEAELRDRLVTI